MPHVKGNKFKPKLPTPPPEPEPQPEPVVPAAGGKKGKKKKKQAQQTQQAADVAVEPAVPAVAAAPGAAADGAAAGPPPSKKQKRRQQQQAQLTAIPTVVAPAPKPGAAPAVAAAAATSNWAALKAAMDAAKQQQGGGKPHWHKKRKAEGAQAAAAGPGGAQAAVPGKRPQSMGADMAPTKVVAIDCEMVGVGPNGERSALARVCVVNSTGNVLLDRHVRPKEKVTDFRTKVSGIRPASLREAASFEEVQRQVADLLQGRIVVGHAIENDLEALLLSHRRKDVRDTAKYPPLMKPQARTGRLKPRALRHLASEELGLAIQEGEHSPVDDARAALYLYMKHRKEWERWVASGGRKQDHPATQAAAAAAALGVQGVPVSKSAAARMKLSLEELAKRGSHMADL